ncbi:MAG: putative rane protein [Verrucomicrobiales bacterium]|nr:putative rane protein [Verrucomicrobiales bacterium]MDB6129858.1 putative rane protein [Verrucomicrobiales bacterium]
MILFLRQLQGELVKLFGKRRTYIGFIALLLTQNIFCFLFKFPKVTRHMAVLVQRQGLDFHSYLSALTVATAMIVPLAALLLPLFITLVGGDMVAKEVEDGTMRMVFSRPISRHRVLFLKFLAGSIFCVVLIFLLAGFGLLFGWIHFGWGGLVAFFPEYQIFAIYPPSEGLQHYLFANAALAGQSVTVLLFGLFFSCFNMKPAAATILALSFIIVSGILHQIPYFKDYQGWFLSHHLNYWHHFFSKTPNWDAVWHSFGILMLYNIFFMVAGAMIFHRRDFKS